MKQLFISFACLSIFFFAAAQQDPEFPKGWVMYLEGHDGLTTNFTPAPDLFVCGLRISPQVTIVPGLLRLGVAAGGIFTNKKADATFGPHLVVRLATLNAAGKGSVLNVQLKGEYLWGTSQQRLIGGWLHAEIIQLAVIGFGVHRDYNLNTWWFQGGLGYNLLHKKKPKGIYDPFKNQQQ